MDVLVSIDKYVHHKTIVAGDFNATLRKEDRNHGSQKSCDIKFRDWVVKKELKDLSEDFGIGKYWTFRRGGSKSKIDHILGGEFFCNITYEVENCIFKHMRLKSDHSLLIWTDVSHNSKKRDSLWKFPNKLLKELKFVK